MSDVQFKTIEHVDGSKEDIVEVRLNAATTAVFTPDELVQGTNRTYRDVYSGRYNEFKRGKKDENVIHPEPSEDDERAPPRNATVTGPVIDNTVKGREPAVRHAPVKKTDVKSGKRK